VKSLEGLGRERVGIRVYHGLGRGGGREVGGAVRGGMGDGR